MPTYRWDRSCRAVSRRRSESLTSTVAFDFSGIGILVTGGSGTLGSAIVDSFAEANGRVVAVDRVALPGSPRSDRVTQLVGDLRDDEFLRQVSAAVGDLDCSIVVNSAGLIDTFGSTLDTTNERFQEIVDVNLRGPFVLCREAIRSWLAADVHGVIVNVSSVGAQRAHADNAIYDATKGAIDAFTRALAVDFGPYGIRSNVVAPAAVPSGPTRNLDASIGVPLGRSGLPNDIANAVCFLASDASSFINGHVLAADGGILAQLRTPATPAEQPLHWSGT